MKLHFAETQVIVNHVGEFKEIKEAGKTIMINPQGYQAVLIATCILYIVALLVCFIMVKPSKNKEIA